MTNKIILLITLAICYFNVNAQTRAVTENGDTVVLYSDGTWEYWENFKTGINLPEQLTNNPNPFKKPESAKSKIAGGNDHYEIWYDAKKWKRIPPGSINEVAENALQMIGSDAYLMIIHEQIEIPMETLLSIAVANAERGGSNIKVEEKEYRIVNDKKVLYAIISGETQGIKFIYNSYYYSDSKGTLQITTFTGKSLFTKIRKDMEEVMNGLIIR